MRAVIAFVLIGVLGLPLSPARAETPAPAVPGAQEAVLGLSIRNAHRAYPMALFLDRRVLNDVLGGMEVAVFHDPERRVSSAWFRTVLGEPIDFSGTANGGVAEDLTTVTRWDLTTGVAVGGNLQGQRLVPLTLTTTSWDAWSAAHPNAELYQPGR